MGNSKSTGGTCTHKLIIKQRKIIFIRTIVFFDFYVTLWVIISPNKHILVKIRLEKVDLGEVYIQKEQENFKKRSSSNTIGGHYI